MSDYTVRQTDFDDLMTRASHLFQLNADEAEPGTGQIKIVESSYHAISDISVVVIAEKAGAVVGYSLGYVTEHQHYADVQMLYNDVLFVHPDHRGRWLEQRMMRMSEDIAKYMGANLVRWSAKHGSRLERLLQLKGYRIDESAYQKVLK